jgi:hypothetical protein
VEVFIKYRPEICKKWDFVLWQSKSHKSVPIYRGSPHFVISQFVIPAISWFCFRPQFREFLSISWFWRKKSKKKLFFTNFLDFFFKILIHSFLFIYSDCHLMKFKISLLGMTITRNSISMYTWKWYLDREKIKISWKKGSKSGL